jgi:integrase
MAKSRKENLLKYVHRKLTPKQRKEKNAVGTLYFIRKGLPSVKFDCQDMNDPQFMMEYATLLNGDKQRLMKQPSVRNMVRLIDSYIKSPRYKNLGAKTAQGYDEVLVYLKKKYGTVKSTDWQRKDVIRLRDLNGERNHFANYCVTIIRILFEHAIDLGWQEHNPAKGVGKVASNNPPREPWPIQKLMEYRQVANPRELLLFELLLATGQRIQDVLDFRWTDIRPIDGTVGISLVQNKTKKPLWIPLNENVVTMLQETKRVNEHILTSRYGHGKWSKRGAQQAVASIRKQIGAEKWDVHCLRYTAACDLALAGMDDETIGAVTGQCTATVQHYTKSVRQMANAKRAIMARESMLLKNGT